VRDEVCYNSQFFKSETMINVTNFLYILTGADLDKKVVDTKICNFLSSVGIKSKVDTNTVCNFRAPARNYGFGYCPQTDAHNVLIGLKADGSKPATRKLHPYEDWHEAKKYPEDHKLWQQKYDESGDLMFAGKISWADHMDEYDEICEEFSRGKQIKELPDCCYWIRALQVDTTQFKTNVLTVSTDDRAGLPAWLTIDLIKSMISPYVSTDVLQLTEFKNCRQGPLITFPKYDVSAAGICKMLHGKAVKQPGGNASVKLFFNLLPIRSN